MFSRGRMLADKAVASSSKQAPKLMSRESTKAGTSRSKDILNSITKPVSKFLQLGKSKIKPLSLKLQAPLTQAHLKLLKLL